MRSVKVYEETWPLHTPFVIARGSRSEAHVVVVELEEEGVKGIGECTPYPRYGESDASVMGANHEYCASVGKRADSRSIAETVAGRRGAQRGG
ncbi:putative muconate cycloisomerase I [Salmonella enterica subsp. enterica]|uniref:Putative muconate cycloisomerase I n=1 Tax=Salmonella enterica I TaxID=59201 RepID=A0A379WT23_SALET|nr:putative muconate cycloisomerase I [Salmonella enterica subsp. enterica]